MVLAGLARDRDPALEPAQRVGVSLDERSGVAEREGRFDPPGERLVVAAVELRSRLCDQRRGGLEPTEASLAEGQQRARRRREHVVSHAPGDGEAAVGVVQEHIRVVRPHAHCRCQLEVQRARLD